MRSTRATAGAGRRTRGISPGATHKFVYDDDARRLRPLPGASVSRRRSLRRLGLALALAASGYAITATWTASAVTRSR